MTDHTKRLRSAARVLLAWCGGSEPLDDIFERMELAGWTREEDAGGRLLWRHPDSDGEFRTDEALVEGLRRGLAKAEARSAPPSP